jgi:hypothetical protein
MSAIPDAVGVGTDAGVDTARGPPVAIPLSHVLVGLTFLAAGVTTALVRSAGLAPGTWRLATVHLLLAGWVCCTILGAATQFVPVWSGVRLASRRLAVVQLPLAATGVAGLAAALASVGRTLLRATVEPDPTLRRYLVAVVAGGVWAVATVPAWLADPLARSALYGAPAVRPLLLAGLVGFVVVGSCYHVVPFLLWLERYADRIGFEPVPGVEELYSGRVARADLALTTTGVVALTVAGATPVPGSVRPAGAVALGAGLLAAAGNLVRVVLVHAPGSPRAFLLGRTGAE